jgi:hypothetical protein
MAMIPSVYTKTYTKTSSSWKQLSRSLTHRKVMMDKEGRVVARFFASLGFVCFVVDYQLAASSYTSPMRASTIKPSLDDARAAYRYHTISSLFVLNKIITHFPVHFLLQHHTKRPRFVREEASREGGRFGSFDGARMAVVGFSAGYWTSPSNISDPINI